MARDLSPDVKQEEIHNPKVLIPDADTYFVLLSRDCPGVYLYRPPNTALGSHREILPIVVVCRQRTDALAVHQLNAEIIEKLHDPHDPVELRDAINKSHTARTAFSETSKVPFYALRIARETGIYHGFDWNTEIRPLIKNSKRPEFMSHDTFGDALLWMLNKEHLWKTFTVQPTNHRFGERTDVQGSQSAPLFGASRFKPAGVESLSAPSSPIKDRPRRGSLENTTSTDAACVEPPFFPTVGNIDPAGDSASAARAISRAGSPVKSRATRAASPTKLPISRSMSPTKLVTTRAGSPVKLSSGSGLGGNIRPSTPTREFPTISAQDCAPSGIQSSPSRARARAECAWALQQVIDVSDDEGIDQEQPSAQILDQLRTIIRPAGLLDADNDILIFDLGSSMDVWLAARRMPPLTQVYILQAFLWSANMTRFIVAAGQRPLELSVRDAEYVWRLLTAWVASK